MEGTDCRQVAREEMCQHEVLACNAWKKYAENSIQTVHVERESLKRRMDALERPTFVRARAPGYPAPVTRVGTSNNLAPAPTSSTLLLRAEGLERFVQNGVYILGKDLHFGVLVLDLVCHDRCRHIVGAVHRIIMASVSTRIRAVALKCGAN